MLTLRVPHARDISLGLEVTLFFSVGVCADTGLRLLHEQNVEWVEAAAIRAWQGLWLLNLLPATVIAELQWGHREAEAGGQSPRPDLHHPRAEESSYRCPTQSCCAQGKLWFC